MVWNTDSIFLSVFVPYFLQEDYSYLEVPFLPSFLSFLEWLQYFLHICQNICLDCSDIQSGWSNQIFYICSGHNMSEFWLLPHFIWVCFSSELWLNDWVLLISFGFLLTNSLNSVKSFGWGCEQFWFKKLTLFSCCNFGICPPYLSSLYLGYSVLYSYIWRVPLHSDEFII